MKSEIETRYLSATEVRLISDGEPRVSGYAAIFNSFSEDLGFREIIRPNAFKRTLASSPDVRLLLEHAGLPLARTKSGTLNLYEDRRGLRFEANLDATDPDVQRIVPKIQRGDLNQMSFAFRTITDSWRVENGVQVRELLELDLNDGDVSLVTYPAYQATNASVRDRDIALRSLERWKKSKRPNIAKINALKYL